MPIRAVLFDLDNTLILEDESTFKALGAAATLAHERVGVDAASLATAAAEVAEALWSASPEFAWAEAFGVWWGEGLWGDFAGDAEAAHAMRVFVPGFRVAAWRGALAKVGVTDDALAEELAREYIRARRTAEVIDPDAEPVLAAVSHDRPLALVTNGAGDVQREKLSRTPFARYFAAIAISVEVGMGKPDPGLFRAAARLLGVEPRDAVMVGDSLVRDVRGAQSAGMRAVWIDRGLWDETGVTPDARISALRDLPAALAALEPPSASRPATT